jgi:hypothetical protein
MQNNVIKLICVGFFLSILLLYSELNDSTFRIISGIDEFNSIKLSYCAYESITKGNYFPKVADGIFYNLGYPIFQFISPLPYILIGLLTFIFDNLFTAFSVFVVIFLFISFIFTYILLKYLFKNELYAFTGSVLNLFSPFTTIIRIDVGAYQEFMALCLLPCVIFYLIKIYSKLTYINFLSSVAFFVILIHTHPLTFFYFIFVLTFYLICQILIIVINRIKYKNYTMLIKYIKRINILIIVLLISIFISLWLIAPNFFYRTIYIKYLASNYDAPQLYFQTSLLQLFSVTDAAQIYKTEFSNIRIQSGFIFNLTVFIFLITNIKIKSIYNIPIIVTQLFILVLVFLPFNFLNYINTLIYNILLPISLLKFYQIVGCITIFILINSIINKFKYLHKALFRLIICFSIISFVILSDIPYQTKIPSGKKLIDAVSVNDIAETQFLTGDKNKYYLYQPYNRDDIPNADSDFLVDPISRENPSDQTFVVNLSEYSSNPKYKGYIDFNILYYPDLQNIQFAIDNGNIENVYISENKNSLELNENNVVSIIDIYGFRLNNLPSTGMLKVRAVFEGCPVANLLSVLSLTSFLLMAMAWPLLKIFRRRGRLPGLRPGRQSA